MNVKAIYAEDAKIKNVDNNLLDTTPAETCSVL